MKELKLKIYRLQIKMKNILYTKNQSMIIIALILFLLILVEGAEVNKELLQQWEFQIEEKFENRWFRAAPPPSNIYLDLLENKLIDQPFFRDNFEKTKWLHTTNVNYRTRFNISNIIRGLIIKQLVFEGLDTYATVILNNKVVLNSNNSFIKYTIPLKNLKQFQENVLEVRFQPSPQKDEKGQTTFRLPFAYGWTRKPPYQYSWDWAPELISVGIWQKVYILGYESTRIDYVWLRNKMISANEAIVNVAVVLKKDESRNFMVDIPSQVVIKVEGKEVASFFMKSTVGYKDVSIINPKLWWPHNIGTPYIYNFTIQIKVNRQLVESRNYSHGIRSIQLNTTDGAFQFIVNGYPVYAKGGNYVPPDMFYPRFTNPHFNSSFPLQKLMNTIVESNYNMIRVWGGGQYESDEFYEECSRRGIMVFQDFMFSVNIYPGNETFLRSCEQQVKQQIRRIRNYPALALWSGNNQILQGILNWGWGSQIYKLNYNLLFQKLIKIILEIESPDITYIASSPIYGRGSGNIGDIHSWNVWAAAASFQSYEVDIGRFNSEFGTQALPVWQTIKSFTQQQDRNYQSEILLKHQRHSSKFIILKQYINQHMNPSKDFEMQVYQSGIVQAYAIKLAIAAQRSNKPNTWGTLYWQFNDAWPGISWSSVDYYGRWKPLQYFAKQMYKDIAIFFVMDFQDNIKIVVVNDKLFTVQVDVILKTISFSGEILFNKTQKATLAANEISIIYNIPLNERKVYIGTMPEESVLFSGEVRVKNDYKMTNTFFFKQYKHLKLVPSKLTVGYNYFKNEITLESDNLIKNLFISHIQSYIKLSDNYFDLLPKTRVKVTLQQISLKQAQSKLLFRSLLDTYSTIPSIILNIIYLNQQ